MFLWNFNSLDGVYTYFIINSLRVKVYGDIVLYFKYYNDYDYWYVLEYVSNWVYSITCGFNIIHFDQYHILTLDEVINFLSNESE